MKIVYSVNFLKSLSKLPIQIQRKAISLIELINSNPFHPLLHTKKLSGELAGFFSFRITRDYRIIFQFNNPEIIQLIRVANRKDIYK